jgi:hypothetical protein
VIFPNRPPLGRIILCNFFRPLLLGRILGADYLARCHAMTPDDFRRLAEWEYNRQADKSGCSVERCDGNAIKHGSCNKPYVRARKRNHAGSPALATAHHGGCSSKSR